MWCEVVQVPLAEERTVYTQRKAEWPCEVRAIITFGLFLINTRLDLLYFFDYAVLVFRNGPVHILSYCKIF